MCSGHGPYFFAHSVYPSQGCVCGRMEKWPESQLVAGGPGGSGTWRKRSHLKRDAIADRTRAHTDTLRMLTEDTSDKSRGMDLESESDSHDMFAARGFPVAGVRLEKRLAFIYERRNFPSPVHRYSHLRYVRLPFRV